MGARRVARKANAALTASAYPVAMDACATRFATIGARSARWLLAAMAMLCVVGLAAPAPPPYRTAAPTRSDAALYRAIVVRTVANGAIRDGYYRAAVAEHRLRRYPLRPFVAVRQPTLALLSARLGASATLALYRLLVVVGLGALAWRLSRLPGRIERIAAPLLVLLLLTPMLQPVLGVWHEAWACALLMLAVALRPGRAWPLAIVAALAAALIRELAAPALAAMAYVALAERRRAEAAGWIGALAIVAVALVLHAHAVAVATLATDSVSPGWTRFGGWPFLLAIADTTSLLMLLPGPLAAFALPLAVFGWAARATRATDGAALALVAIMLPFAALGRPENIYWGLLVAPLLPVGLVFAPAALRDLARAARQAPPPRPCDRPWTTPASS